MNFDNSIQSGNAVLASLEKSIKEVLAPNANNIQVRVNALFDTTDQRLAQSHERFEQAVDTIDNALDDAVARISAIDQEVIDMVQELYGRQLALHEHVVSWTADNENKLNAILQANQNTVGNIQNWQGNLQQAENEQQQLLEEWVSLLNEEMTSLSGDFDQVAEHMSRVSETSASHTQTMLGDLSMFDTNLESDFDLMASNVERDEQQLIGEFQQKLSGLTGEFDQHASLVTGALNMFGEEGNAVSEMFDGSVGEVMDHVEKVKDVVDTIKPFIDFVKKLA